MVVVIYTTNLLDIRQLMYGCIIDFYLFFRTNKCCVDDLLKTMQVHQQQALLYNIGWKCVQTSCWGKLLHMANLFLSLTAAVVDNP